MNNSQQSYRKPVADARLKGVALTSLSGSIATTIDVYIELSKAELDFSKERNIIEIHMTKDFSLKLQASPLAAQYYHRELNNLRETFHGHKIIIHKTAEKEFWFEPSEVQLRYEDFK